MVQNFIPTFCLIVDKTVDRLAVNHTNGEEFDIHHYTERCMVQMILASSLDIFPDDIEGGGDEEFDFLVEAIRK